MKKNKVHIRFEGEEFDLLSIPFKQGTLERRVEIPVPKAKATESKGLEAFLDLYSPKALKKWLWAGLLAEARRLAKQKIVEGEVPEFASVVVLWPEDLNNAVGFKKTAREEREVQVRYVKFEREPGVLRARCPFCGNNNEFADSPEDSVLCIHATGNVFEKGFEFISDPQT